MSERIQKLVAEFIGTFTLIFIGGGAACVDTLTNHGIGLIGIALAHGLAIAIMVTATGPISGGHLNPAVTIGALVGRKISFTDAVLYWISQVLGGVAGAVLLALIFRADIWRPSIPTDLGSGVTPLTGIITELILSFLLVYVVYATAIDERGMFKAIAGFAIGLTITMDILAGGPISGASMNPARSFGPALIAGHWQNQIVYWIGPLLGGVIAGGLYSAVFLKKSS